MRHQSGPETREVAGADEPIRAHEPEEPRPPPREIEVDDHSRPQPRAVLPSSTKRLVDKTLRLGDRLRCGVVSVCREDSVDVTHLEATPDPEEQLVVQRVAKRDVEPANRLESPTREERTGLRDEVGLVELLPQIERHRRELAHDVSALVDLPPTSMDQPGPSLLHDADGSADCSRKVEIVGVEPAEDLARCQGETLVDRVGLPLVGLRDPAHLRVAPQDLQRLVRRSAVDDNVLDAWVVLAENTLDRLLDEGTLVHRRRDDRH